MFNSPFFAALLLTALYCHTAAAGWTNATTTSTASSATSTIALDSNATNCFITVPNDPLSATGLASPYILQPPCSMAVATQQAFAEAAIYDPNTGAISIYHPLVLDAGVNPAAAPVVPVLPPGAIVGLWFGFNGDVLQLLDSNGKDTYASPLLESIDCVNGLSGAKGDVFGQVSWCNAEAWFAAVNSGIAAKKVVIPPLGLDKLGNTCPTSRSFSIVDQDPSDNVPTQYLLAGNATAQDTAANRKALPNGEVINNASDEALLTNILDPIIGCTPFLAPSIDDPGAMVPALALSELQASLQPAPIGFVPLNDPDCLLTNGGAISIEKTNTYRLGVNQPLVGNGDASGALQPYCDNLVAVAPVFLKGFQDIFTAQTSPDPTAGNNLFTFLCNRFLGSLSLLTCPTVANQPISCTIDSNGVATSCEINLANTATANNTALSSSTENIATSTAGQCSVNTTTSTTALEAIAIATSSVTTTSAAAVTTTAIAVTTQVVTIEIISFFTFVINLGGALPPPVKANKDRNRPFIVIAETFVELSVACQHACNHQFTSCTNVANRGGATFAVADCEAQENKCLGVAATASATNSVPATVTATATVTVTTSSGQGNGATVTTDVVQGGGGAAAETVTATSAQGFGGAAVETVAAAGAQGDGQKAECPAPTATVTVFPPAITETVSQCTATVVSKETVTVTVTASSSASMGFGAASATAQYGYLNRRAGHRRALGKYN